MAKLNLNGQAALDEIKRLIAEINQLKAASKGVSSATASSFSNMESSVARLKSKIASLTHQIKYLEGIIKKQSSATSSNTSTTNKNTSATNKNTTAKTSNANATKKNAQATTSFNLSLSNLIRGGILLKATQLLRQLTENVYDNIKTFDSLGFTLEKITKNSFDYENSQRFLLRITEAYGVELVTTTQRWSRFLAAATESGLALREAENIFESMTKASSALGLETHDLASVYLALEQMLSKGKVSTEELRRQLGEKLPGAMGIMAASMGVTIPELDKMLKLGQVMSADVLPDFARAVERAYGIENADRIETLVAKQNRLGAAWQSFIKNVGEGDSVIKKVFGGMLEFLQGTIEAWDRLLQSVEQKSRKTISVLEERYKKSLEESFAKTVDFAKNISETDIQLKFKEDRLLEQLKTATGEQREIIKQEIDEIARIRIEKDKESLALQKEFAKKEVATIYAKYERAKAIWEDAAKKRDELREKEKAQEQQYEVDPSTGVSIPIASMDSTELQAAEKNAKEALEAYEDLTAMYNVLRKLVDESDVEFIPSDDQVAKTKYRLRQIRDYSLEIINEIAGHVRDSNMDMFGDETLDLNVRLNAMKRAIAQETLIKRNQLELEKQDIEDKYALEISKAKEAVAKGRLSAAELNQFLIDLDKEKNQQLVLAAQKTGHEIAEINKKAAESIKDLSTSVFEEGALSNTEDLFNKRIIAAKREYEASKKTAKDKEKLEKDLAKIAIESTNAIIDVKIKLLKEEIRILQESGQATSEYIEKLLKQIAALEASKQVAPPIDGSDWKEQFEEALRYAAEFNNAIGAIVDNLFERKIENINAEIEAEKDKYDQLIALAENDEEQQATLQRNKEDRIRKLEKRRLKEQQKQAKANKAFAIADIAINTAVAISKVLGQSGIFGIPLVPVVAALGALQMAAVLAAPIPKYKDGVKNLHEDQVAMINDGSYKEYVERNGRILTTDKKNAVVGLQKGDTVWKNYDEMISKSNLFKIKNRIALNPEKDNHKLLRDITGAIVKGYTKAKINNNIHLVNKGGDNNAGYANELSRWN